jgi:hypothetical protein
MEDVYQAYWHDDACVKMLHLASPTNGQLFQVRFELQKLYPSLALLPMLFPEPSSTAGYLDLACHPLLLLTVVGNLSQYCGTP